MISVREIDRSLEQWQMKVKDLRRRMILAPTPRERERWYAILPAGPRLEGIGHGGGAGTGPTHHRTMGIGLRGGGPAALIFEQTGGFPPPPLTRRNRGS